MMKVIKLVVMVLGLSLLTGSVLEAVILYSPKEKLLLKLKARKQHEKNNLNHDTEGSVSR